MNRYTGNGNSEEVVSPLSLAAQAASIRRENGRSVWPPKIAASLLAVAQLCVAISGAQAATTTELIGPTMPAPSNSSITAPASGVIINGTNLKNGVPVRHLWTPDHLKGICRVDPDIDSGGPFHLNDATCMSFVGGTAIKPGQLAYDPNTQNVYAVDLSAKNQGIFRLGFAPGGDNGEGALDQFRTTALGGLNGGCGIPGNVPNSASLGPDNNLYIGFKRSGNIVRIVNPAVDPLPCGNVQTIGTTADGKKNFGFGWIGHDLYGADGLSAWVIPKADQCFTPANGNTSCKGSSILVGQIAVPSIATTDQVYPSLNGSTLYLGNPTSVTAIRLSPLPAVVDTNFGTGFSFVSGLAVDMANPSNKVVYAADDTTNGASVGTGRLWSITTPAPAPAAPGAPAGVTATPQDAAVALKWNSGTNGSQPTTSYTISATPQGGATQLTTVSIVPPASAPPTSAVVTSLVNGTTYDFTVTATNSVGTSPPSSPVVSSTPAPATAPGAPTNVSAIAGNAAASVAWTAPVSDGGSPLTGYAVTSSTGSAGAVTPAPANVAAGTTGTVINGLTNGVPYTFTVAAVNAKGSTPSTPSAPVTPSAVSGPPDMVATMTGPATVNFGANATYTITATNNGPAGADQVIVTDTLPASGASLVGTPAASQGTCLVAAGQPVTCNLGGIPAGSSATVTVTLNVTGKIVNTASVQANTATGTALTDPSPGNNTTSVTTDLAVATTTTDLQTGGSAKNGGPAVGSSDTYSWQIKNVGRSAANATVFTNDLPNTLAFVSASTSLGTCTGPAANAAGGTVRCSADSLPAGQTMLVTVNVLVPTAGAIATTGTASFSGTDSNPGNNSATVTIQAK